MTQQRATIFGFIAILLWALLALLTILAGPVPPLLLNALCLGIGALAGLLRSAWQREWVAPTSIPLAGWALGIAGLFGYHALYFAALQMAPPEQASLIAYLWPLFIVLFSGLLPGEKLRRAHLFGALIAFAGTIFLLGGGTPELVAWPGYLIAFACALTWSGYSVLSRLFAAIPSAAVTYFCAIASLLSALLHMIFEPTIWPASSQSWAAIFALGLGPTGLAFFFWDGAMKHGNISLLGVAAYLAPLLSTFILIATGFARPEAHLLIAATCITAGPLLALRRG